ncbi:hypothetical protein I6D31_00825 [Staphylococcus aureus]|nr:hypothetical protein [Staphylococcus aureus]
MVPEEKGSITLSKEAATIFATAKFKPFHNRIKNNPQKTNPWMLRADTSMKMEN